MPCKYSFPTCAWSVPKSSVSEVWNWVLCRLPVCNMLREHEHEPPGAGGVLGKSFFCLRKLLLGAGDGGLMGQRLEWKAES